MRNYFKPLRWKFGLVILVLACLTMCAWGRSFNMLEVLMYSDTKWTSTCGGIYWERGFPKKADYKFSLTNTYYFDSVWFDSDPYQEPTLRKKWVWDVSGLATCDYDSPDDADIRMKAWRFPYWWISLPLTLLSAWLLLGNPRPKKPSAAVSTE